MPTEREYGIKLQIIEIYVISENFGLKKDLFEEFYE